MWIATTVLLLIICAQLIRGLHLRVQLDDERRAHAHTKAMRRVAEAQLSSSLALTLHEDFERNRKRVSESAKAVSKASGHGPN